MKNFIITTNSTFVNKYKIRAPNIQLAIEQVLDNDEAPNFYQKHLGEDVTHYIEVDDNYNMHEEMHRLGFW